MHLIDTHCHISHGRLVQQFDAVVQRAREAGVKGMVIAAGDLEESRTALELAGRDDHFRAMAGIHPHEARHAPHDAVEQIRALQSEQRIVAVGEIGLDYHYDFSPRPKQRALFAAQLDLARDLGTVAVIHTREAFEDTLGIIHESAIDGRQIVFHSFTAGVEEAGRVLDLGATLSYSGIATFRKTDALREAVAFTPADRILIETDAPFLSPEPVRSMKTNEPANVVHIARRLAEVRDESFDDFARQTTSNASRLFGIVLDE